MTLSDSTKVAIIECWNFFTSTAKTYITEKDEETLASHLQRIADITEDSEIKVIAEEAHSYWIAYRGTPAELNRLLEYRFNSMYRRLEKLASAADCINLSEDTIVPEEITPTPGQESPLDSKS